VLLKEWIIFGNRIKKSCLSNLPVGLKKLDKAVLIDIIAGNYGNSGMLREGYG
jgi:hypothetical protein